MILLESRDKQIWYIKRLLGRDCTTCLRLFLLIILFGIKKS
jgi:hypothetical protein